VNARRSQGRRSRLAAALAVGALAALAPLLSVDCASGLPAVRALDASTPEGATAASNAFGFDLYARVKRDDSTLICSPFSAAVALNMASAGARGPTREQMLRVLRVDPQHAAETHASFGGLLGQLNARNRTGDVELHVADRLWGQSGVLFRPDFLALLRDSYRAPLEAVDFANAPEVARTAVNKWVSAQTHDRIPEILGAGDVDRSTRLVLTNAVYFEGDWENPFDDRATRPRLFSGGSGGRYVPIMAQEDSFAYLRDGDIQVIELTYRGDLSMVVVLPDGAGDLPAVERKLADHYAGWVGALRRAPVDLWLPRWTSRSRLDLRVPLQAAGMRLAFTPDGDFSGTSEVPLFIDKVAQEAFIAVNERGTEAAAATAVIETTVSEEQSLVKPKIFHADHPFLYLLRDRKTGAVLFLGRVAALGG
jgi:serpin B